MEWRVVDFNLPDCIKNILHFLKGVLRGQGCVILKTSWDSMKMLMPLFGLFKEREIVCVCVRKCVHVCVCIHISIHIYLLCVWYTCVYAYSCAYRYTWKWVYMHIFVHVYRSEVKQVCFSCWSHCCVEIRSLAACQVTVWLASQWALGSLLFYYPSNGMPSFCLSSMGSGDLTWVLTLARRTLLVELFSIPGFLISWVVASSEEAL